ncbi:MAG: toll/interleukin-1 receptor domain-containing protein, partial [Desulfobacterales bacterium]
SVQVPYKVFYAYEEVLATFADTPMQTDSVLNAVEALTGYLVGSETHLRPPKSELRHTVLEQFERKEGPSAIPSKETKPSYRIFLSHAHEDEMFARALSDLLSAFFAERVVVNRRSASIKKIAPESSDYQDWLKDQISSCDVMIVVLGSQRNELSPWISQDVGMAVAYNKQLIPVIFGGGYEKIPAILSKFQMVSGHDPQDMLRLLEHLNRELALYPESVFIRAAESMLSDYLKGIESAVKNRS